MIRHYEAIGLIPKAARRDSGYRDYDDKDLHTLRFIGRARDLGFSIAEIGQLLRLWQDRSLSNADVRTLALSRAADFGRKALLLEGLRRTLERLASACHGDERANYPIFDDVGFKTIGSEDIAGDNDVL